MIVILPVNDCSSIGMVYKMAGIVVRIGTRYDVTFETHSCKIRNKQSEIFETLNC